MKYQSKTHQEATGQKMSSVAQYQKSPKNWDKIDKQTQEHFEDHNHKKHTRCQKQCQ